MSENKNKSGYSCREGGSMSKTPRTDEQILHHDNGNGHPSAFVFASFTRQLETELADKDKLIEQMREALRLALPEARSTHVEWAIKIALKAERGE